MINRKPINGYIKINQYDVEIETDINYQAIEISFNGIMDIQPLIGKNYIIKKGYNKIIIAKLNYDYAIVSKIFKYRGIANINSCTLIDKDYNKYNIYVDKSILQIWNRLKGYVVKYSESNPDNNVKQDWAYLTRNWEDIEFDGNNNKYSYIHVKTNKNVGTGTHSITREVRKK